MTRREIVLIAAAFTLLAWQLLLPGFIGMANNGDFPRVTGRFCLQPAEGGWADNFVYFVSRYHRAAAACWNSESPGTATWLTALAGGGITEDFDIRRLGAIYSAIFLTGFGALLVALRPLGAHRQTLLALLALLLFADVRNVAYFNSFFTDAPALAALCLLVPGGLLRSSWLIGAGAFLFAASKGQHALAAWPFLVLLLMTRRRTAQAAALFILVVSVWVYHAPPRTYQAQAAFNAIFFRILPNAASPETEASELGLRPDDLRFVGQHAFVPDSQALNPPWMDEFSRRVSHENLMSFYWKHPAIALDFLWSDLKTHATVLRPPNLSNFERRAGRPAGTLDQRFALWTRAREIVQRSWPWVLALVHLLLTGLAIRLALQGNWTLLALEAAALCEFVPASLGDCLETYRHLQVFQAMTDWGIWVAITALVSKRITPRGSSALPS